MHLVSVLGSNLLKMYDVRN